MSRISRLAVLVTALASLFAVLSSAAGATTFTNSGSTSFSAASVVGTLTVTGTNGNNNLTCGTSTATGTVPTGAFTAVNGTITFSFCKLIGLETHADCNYSLTPVTFTSPSVTDGVLDVHCVIRLGTSPFVALCNVTGQTGGSYTNPDGGAPGQLTLASSNTLVVSNASGSNCSAVGVPAGEMRPADLTERTYTITNGTPTPLGPVIASP